MEENTNPTTAGPVNPAPEAAAPAEPEKPAQPEQNSANLPPPKPLETGFFEGQPTEAVGGQAGPDAGKDSNDKKDAGDKLDWRTIVSVLFVLGVIVLAIWYSDRGNNASNLKATDNSTTTVKVSDQKEQGNVNIVDEDKAKLITDEVTVSSSSTGEKVEITAYFGNTVENPNAIDCSRVFVLKREVDKKYDSDMVNTLRGLLFALTDQEKAQGYVSNIPAGTMLKYVKVGADGAAEVHFTSALNNMGGSCAVAAARAQIEQTVKQFGYVKSVVICADENCKQDEILQP